MTENGSQTAKFVGVEVSRKAFVAVCLDADGAVRDAFRMKPTAQRQDVRGTVAELINFINQAKTRFGEFQTLGIAVPGLLHRKTGRVAFSTYIPEHEQVDFPAEIERATGLAVALENDANAAAYGEFRVGAGRGARDLFYATLGTGIGGAFVLNGEVWRGASGFAGEFGYTAINSEGMRLEDVASAAGIVRRTRSRFYQDNTSSLSSLDAGKITLADVVLAARKHDDFARIMLERTGTYVGAAIAGVINLLDVGRIVVGGEIMQAERLVLDAIIKRARELSFAPSFEGTEILAGELGDAAAATGVALLSARTREL